MDELCQGRSFTSRLNRFQPAPKQDGGQGQPEQPRQPIGTNDVSNRLSGTQLSRRHRLADIDEAEADQNNADDELLNDRTERI